MAIYTKESLETLRQKIDLVDVLSSHIELKKAGASYKALCPFHDEKSPSFMVQRGDSHYHCFGCGAHGDAISFLMMYLKMGFGEAVESLAERFSVHLEHAEGGSERKGPSKAALKEALETACRFYHMCLLHTEEGHAALKYLQGRSIDIDFICQFQIGLAPKAPGLFRKTMHALGFQDPLLQEAGLLSDGREGRLRDFFYDRITFPIRDAAGAVIGFSARKYKEETFGGKYVNTSETVLFKKSRVLFGLNYCRRRIAKERKALIVEGQIDALRLIQAGFNITVAGQGTAFGEGHARELISLGIQDVFLALDADDAGQEATKKIGNIFQKNGVGVRVVKMPFGSDPDAFLREKGSEEFLALMEASVDYLTFLFKHESRRIDLNNPAGKNELVQNIAKTIREWDRSIMIHESLRKLAFLAQVPEHVLGFDQERQSNLYIKKSGVAGAAAIDPNRILETDFLRWLLLMGGSNPEFLSLAKQNIPADFMTDPACAQFYQTYLQESNPQDLLALAGHLGEEGQVLIAELLEKKVNKERAMESYRVTLQKLLDRQWMQKREELKVKIQSGQCSDDEAMTLIKQFDELKRTAPQIRG